MSSRTILSGPHIQRRLDGRITVSATAPPSEAQGTAPAAPTEDAIAQRAFEKFEVRGGAHGLDHQDWLDAERELRAEHAATLATRT